MIASSLCSPMRSCTDFTWKDISSVCVAGSVRSANSSNRVLKASSFALSAASLAKELMQSLYIMSRTAGRLLNLNSGLETLKSSRAQCSSTVELVTLVVVANSVSADSLVDDLGSWVYLFVAIVALDFDCCLELLICDVIF